MGLPAVPADLIGRDADMAAARGELLREGTRLLTLTGPGGSGKTRLAIALADQVRDAFPGGRYFVDLSPVRDPGRVLATICREIGAVGAADDRFAALAALLDEADVLLVLDNFEQVIAAATLVSDLLAACRRLRIVVTSREALRLRWEHERVVGPLALPQPKDPLDVDALEIVPSVALFLHLARAADASFALTRDNASTVAELCVRADGLPLAVELAVAQLRALSPLDLLALVRARTPLPSAAPRDAPARHRTVRAAMDWSYDLLGADERRALGGLAVFAGTFTLDAATEVLGPTALRVITTLVAKSLVRRMDDGDGPTFGLLPTIRDHARERSAEHGQLGDTRQRHAGYFFKLVEDGEAAILGSGERAWLGRLERAHEDILDALRWAIDSGRIEEAAHAALSLTPFWYRRGHLRGSEAWFGELLDRLPPERTPLRGGLLSRSAQAARARGDTATAGARAADALAMYRDLGNEAGILDALELVGMTALDEERPNDAHRAFAEGLRLAPRAGTRHDLLSLTLHLAEAARRLGRREEAERLCARGGDLAATEGHAHGVALARHCRAALAADRGDLDGADALGAEAVAIFQSSGDQGALAPTLDLLVGIAVRRGRHERAARLLGASDRLRASSGPTLAASAAAERGATASAARRALGDIAFASARALGGTLSAAEIAAYAASREAEVLRPIALTARELEVAQLVAEGLTNRQIADLLVIGERTVETHVEHLLRKLEIENRHSVAERLATGHP